jgi:hypothetical protein
MAWRDTFFGGIYVGNCLGDVKRKLRLLEASTHVLGHSVGTGLQFAQEAAAFLPVATYNCRIALAENLEAETPQGLGIVVADPAARPSKDQISTFRKKLKTVHSRIAMNLQSSADRRGRAKKPFKNIKRWLAKPGRWRQRA